MSGLSVSMKMTAKQSGALYMKAIKLEDENKEMRDFLSHILKCVEKNGEYAPLSTEAIDKVLGIDRGAL